MLYQAPLYLSETAPAAKNIAKGEWDKTEPVLVRVHQDGADGSLRGGDPLRSARSR